LAAVAFVLTAGGVLWHYYQSGRISRFFSCWFVLFFLIKLPMNMDIDLIFWLQGITSALASGLLDFIGINHVLAGHNIRIADAGFAVEEACSGIQSLFSLLAMTALFLAFCRRSLTHSVLLLLAAVCWACLINVIRVATVVAGYEKFDIDLTLDRPHEILGLVLFACALGLMFSTDRLLLFLTADDTPEGAEDEPEIQHFKTLNSDPVEPTAGVPTVPETSANTDASRSDARVEEAAWKSKLVLGCFVFLACAQGLVMFLTQRGLGSIDPDDPRLVGLFIEDTLPETIGNWTRKEFSAETRSLTNYQGRHSAQWIYDSELGDVVIAVDYPFLGWHELTGCYIAEGCQIKSREISDSAETVRATITAPSGANARLLFTEYTKTGRPLSPLGNDAGTISYWRSRLESALLRQFASFQQDAGSFQVQLLYYFDETPTAAVDAELSSLHRITADHITNAITEAIQ
jgi:exosortase